MFSDEERSALRAYCGDDYRLINACLRGEEPSSERLHKYIASIDSALRKAPQAKVSKLYTGIDGDVLEGLKAAGLGPGTILTVHDYTSTSTHELTARTFAAWPPGLVIELKCRPHVRALDLSPFSPFPGEREFLLPRNMKILVISVEYGKRLLQAEIM